MNAAFRCQNRPAHVCKSIAEKRGVQFHDVMLRFKPGDMPRSAVVLDRPKPYKRAHLVNVVVHSLFHAHEIVYVRINGDLKQVRLAVCQPPKQAVEQRPTFWIAMTGHAHR